MKKAPDDAGAQTYMSMKLLSQELTEHVLENAAVAIVIQFVGAIDGRLSDEVEGLSIFTSYFKGHALPRLHGWNALKLEGLFAGQAIGLAILAIDEGQRQNAETDEIR